MRDFKRFSDLTLQEIPQSAKLVVLVGPNGTGKSSVFDAFRQRHGEICRSFRTWDESYHRKHKNSETEQGADEINQHNAVELEFYGVIPEDEDEKKKIFYIRSPYRHQASITGTGFAKQGAARDKVRTPRMIDSDALVAENYQRLTMKSVMGVYDESNDEKLVRDLRGELFGKLKESLGRVFDDLEFTKVGNPLEDEDFFFKKGRSLDFRYLNLSSGEKAAFDLLLDYIVKLEEFDDTIFCLDEPELHIHTRVQAKLLAELFRLTPDNCQLWISTHSVGMMRQAQELQRAGPESVALLDFFDTDFDKATVLTPQVANREFWKKTLSVALDDIADLVAPSTIVICEGDMLGTERSEFDARCLRNVFQAYEPDIEFVAGGSGKEVEKDRLRLTAMLGIVVKGAQVVRLVDRDDKSDTEVRELENDGVRVTNRRNLESYLLDDEVLSRFCVDQGKDDFVDEILNKKKELIAESVNNGKPADDVKPIKGALYNYVRTTLELTATGSSADVFIRDFLAPMVKPDTGVYRELQSLFQ